MKRFTSAAWVVVCRSRLYPKWASTESLLILKRNGYATATITFEVGEALGCAIVGVGERGEKVDEFEDEISSALLSALVGKVNFTKENEFVTGIVFEG